MINTSICDGNVRSLRMEAKVDINPDIGFQFSVRGVTCRTLFGRIHDDSPESQQFMDISSLGSFELQYSQDELRIVMTIEYAMVCWHVTSSDPAMFCPLE